MDANDFEGRLSAVEEQVRDIDSRLRATSRDAAAARILAGAADRDVSAFRAELNDFRRATTASFNALREDVVDGFAEMRGKFHEVDRGFAEMRGKLDSAAAGQRQIVELIERVLDKDD